MGTFHDTKDPLHGITVVARMGNTVHVGRCHERDESSVVLLDADTHAQNESGQGEDGRSNQEYLERTARFGVWARNKRLTLPAGEIESLIPLSSFFRKPGQPAPKPQPVATPAAAVGEAKPLSSMASDSDQAVQLTDAACEEVRRLLTTEDQGGKDLRLGVAGGGCSGLTYKVEFGREQDGDLVIPQEGFNVLLDRKSTIYLRGIILDHQSGLGGRGFQFQNPNASNTCGCGESFSV